MCLLYKRGRLDTHDGLSPEFTLEIDKMFSHFIGYIITYDIDQAQTSYNKRSEHFQSIFYIHGACACSVRDI